MISRGFWAAIGAASCLASAAGAADPSIHAKAAADFGAREDAEQVSLSPDGTQIAYLAPGPKTSTFLVVRNTADDAKPHIVTLSDGKPNRLAHCRWVSNARLVCTAYAIVDIDGRKIPYTRLWAIDSDGKNLKMLSTRQDDNSRGIQLGGGSVIDWLPDQDGSVLMTRNYIPMITPAVLSASARKVLPSIE